MGCGQCVWDISEQIQDTAGHHGAKAKVVRDIVFTCVVLRNMLMTPQSGADMAPTPANEVASLQNGQVVYVPDDNYRNPLKEAKHQRELLQDCFNHVGELSGQEDRI